MNKLDRYIIECVSNNKKPGGRRISNLLKEGLTRTIPDEIVYSMVTNTDIPNCDCCKVNKVRLISFKDGYGKYCSKDCYVKILADRNSKNNKIRNKLIGERKKKRNIEKLGDNLEKAVNEYIQSDTISISEISLKYDISIGYVREKLLEYYNSDFIPKERKVSAWKNKLADKMKDVDLFLCDESWVKDAQENGKTSKMVAKELGCSPNYVASKTRDLGFPFKHNTSSSYEIMLNKFFVEKGLSTITGERKLLNGFEIDLYIPDHQIGIEVNGVYWHQFVDDADLKTNLFGRRNKDKNYHQFKTKLAEKKGVQLLHIFDYEFDDPIKLDIFKSIVLGKCGLNKTIYARKCELKEINSTEYQTFLTSNHIKGKIASKVKIGLFFENELVMVSGFSKPRFTKKYQWELIRMCSKKGFTIVGGPSKMFKYFINQYRPEAVISYCDKRFFNGAVYEKIGMKKMSSQQPNYVWVGNKDGSIDVKSRYSSQKHKISNDENKHLTEDQIMKMNGYMKIFDCGQDVFVWKSNDK